MFDKMTDKITDKITDQISDTMTVRKLQPTKTSTNGSNIKRDQIVIPPFVASVYEHNLSEKLIDRRRKKTPPTKKTSTKIPSMMAIRPSKTVVNNDVGDSSKPKLRFNVDDFRKKFNLRAVAIAELVSIPLTC